MTPQLLLQHFDRIGEAPDAILRLRRFILDLAVRGKLVEQDPRDEPASELLKRIATAKILHGRVERVKSAVPASLESEPFSLPAGWSWAALAALVTVLNGRAYSQNELLNAGTPVLRVGNLFTSKHWYYSNLELEEDKYCNDGDLIFSWSASFGPFIWQGPKVIYHYHIWKLDLHSDRDLDKYYLYRFLLQKTQEIKESGHGISMIHMTKEKMEKLQVPLPPLAEQQRIVAKVDELMALCDRLEAAQTERESRRDRLVASSLHRLNNGAEVDAFREHARFYFNHLPRLTTRPHHIKQLRQTILNLAVRGKLVPQNSTDEPASELLKRIQVEKSRLFKEGKIRKPEPPLRIDDEELPFKVPPVWCWARLGTISRKIHYGYTASANKLLKEVRLLRITDIQDNEVDWATVPGCEISDRDIDQYKLEQGDILIARTGGTIGKTFLVKHAPVTAVFASYLIRVQGTSELYDQYLKLFLESPTYWKQLQDGARGAGQPNVNGQTLGRMVVTIPPLAEQHRIVAKVDELMSLCDQLETQLTTTQSESHRLLEATLHYALST